MTTSKTILIISLTYASDNLINLDSVLFVNRNNNIIIDSSPPEPAPGPTPIFLASVSTLSTTEIVIRRR
jgi:hypothetical protein